MKIVSLFALTLLFACASQQINNYTSNPSEIGEKYEGSDLDSIINPYK